MREEIRLRQRSQPRDEFDRRAAAATSAAIAQKHPATAQAQQKQQFGYAKYAYCYASCPAGRATRSCGGTNGLTNCTLMAHHGRHHQPPGLRKRPHAGDGPGHEHRHDRAPYAQAGASQRIGLFPPADRKEQRTKIGQIGIQLRRAVLHVKELRADVARLEQVVHRRIGELDDQGVGRQIGRATHHQPDHQQRHPAQDGFALAPFPDLRRNQHGPGTEHAGGRQPGELVGLRFAAQQRHDHAHGKTDAGSHDQRTQQVGNAFARRFHDQRRRGTLAPRLPRSRLGPAFLPMTGRSAAPIAQRHLARGRMILGGSRRGPRIGPLGAAPPAAYAGGRLARGTVCRVLLAIAVHHDGSHDTITYVQQHQPGQPRQCKGPGNGAGHHHDAQHGQRDLAGRVHCVPRVAGGAPAIANGAPDGLFVDEIGLHGFGCRLCCGRASPAPTKLSMFLAAANPPLSWETGV